MPYSSISKETSEIYVPDVEFEVKTDSKTGKKKYVVKGRLSVSNEDTVGDILTENAQNSMLSQIQTGLIEHSPSLKGDLDHETVKIDRRLPPRSRITNAEKTTIDGYAGIEIETELNQFHPEFNNFKNMVQDEWLDGYSIEFTRPSIGEFVERPEGGRILDEVHLTGYAHTGKPINPMCNVTDFVVKSRQEIDEAQKGKEAVKAEIKAEVINSKEVKMAEDEKPVEAPVEKAPEEAPKEAPAETKPEEETPKEEPEATPEPAPEVTPEAEDAPVETKSIKELRAELEVKSKEIDQLKSKVDEITTGTIAKEVEVQVKSHLKNLNPEDKAITPKDEKFEQKSQTTGACDPVKAVCERYGVKHNG